RCGWRAPVCSEHFCARPTPAAGRLAFGAALALAGQHPDPALQRRFDAHWRTPAELRREVPDAALRAGRRASAFFGALACAALALTAAAAAGLAAGLVAGLLLLANESFAPWSLPSSPVLPWLPPGPPVSASALAALRRGWRDPARGARPLALAASAVLAPALVVALAAGTKPNGGLLGFAYALALLGAALLPA